MSIFFKIFLILFGIITIIFIFNSMSNLNLNNDKVNSSSSSSSLSFSSSNSQINQIDAFKVETLIEGSGDKIVQNGDNIEINYLGTLVDGTKFDSSYDRGQPFSTQIGVGKVIEGWDKGVIGMKVGEKRKLTIPPKLGYGETPIGNIPANSTLIFEVELVSIK